AGYSEKKEYYSDEDDQNIKERNRASQRCGCPFYICASLNDNNEDVKQKIELLRRAGVDVPTIRSILNEEFGTHVTWMYNDIYNFVYQLESSNSGKKEFEAEEFINVLEQIKNNNDEFQYYTYINDDTRRLERIIWMFPEQRINYSRFYDIVIYDNTYKTNRFHMPFGVFTGVNNYGYSICFAGALMINETEENFIWVFNNFLKMVNQNAPLVILTDDDRAMANAYTKILKPLAFVKDFYKCLGELDISDFLTQWEILKALYPPASSYLLRMETTKEKWAACYNLDTFMADMNTTQRGESMNNMLKGYLDASTSLITFLNAFQSALEVQKEKTEFTIYRQNNYNILYKTTNPHEFQCASILTSYSYKKTQEQLLQSSNYKFNQLKKFSLYKGMNEKQMDELHIFRTATQLNLTELPLSIFYERWRKDPSEEKLIKNYITFTTSTTGSSNIPNSNLQQLQQLSNNEFDNYEYMLTRLLQKVKRF
ncbi:12076_t:CDS:2, partial [Dentiscutata erythropus]